MQSPIKQSRDSDVAIKATWLLLAVAINALELAFPRLPFLPWLKPGLANTITIIWIVKYGLTDALLFTTLRVWISGFYFGFSLITMSLGFGGGILSTLAMGLTWSLLGKHRMIGTIGLGMIGALFHNIGQIVVVYLLMARNFRIFYQMPFMLGAALILGGAVGALALPLMRLLEKSSVSDIQSKQETNKIPPGLRDKVAVAFTLILSFTLVFISDIILLAAAAICFSLISIILQKRGIRSVLFPLKLYWIFLFSGFVHLFFSYGTKVELLPFVTEEGIQQAILQWIRLWTWLHATTIFRRFKFHDIFFDLLGKVFPLKSSTLDAGLIALDFFPETLQHSGKQRGANVIRRLLKAPVQTLFNYVEGMNQRIGTIITQNSELKT
ncbi:Gx transporter family protein [Chitinispirillales bacterium ANBcel5]|uniref:Gx transporter family protein n=1 Tax=Cellulosispirillum alkaliphilum TaxID=3039283 RepID=UPI002A554B0E|nr:Gx transporter family protein [Chitinispirillales bacterium ANBcel5]